MPASLGELATEFGCELTGDPEVRVDRVATLASTSADSVGFLASPAYRNELLATRAAVVLTEVDHNARRGEALEKRVTELEPKVNKNDG